ncbi:MAG: AAA family ATPase [Saprospiraceae bacterium]|nr:AAA family ATPase [Saprospiraceae bacterium]
MKILCLRCKNIHSLKGEHIIHFDQPPLSEAGLFAITGPTGSGKSTLLDVITLSLFNKIPRFTETGKETVTKNEIERAGSVMTHHTDHSYAEIDYEADGKRYRSTWTISKTKNGTLRDYEMTLATLPEKEFFDLKKSQVPTKNEEILHLTYEQFIRSILLSQGQFAKLLRSDEKERARLLENITGTSIYRRLGKVIYQKARSEEKEHELLQKELDLMPRLTEEEVAFFQSQTSELEDQLSRLSAEADGVLQNIERHKQYLGIKAALEKDSSELQILEQNLRDLEHVVVKLQQHEQLQPLHGTFALWENAGKQCHVLETEIDRTLQKKSLAEEKLGSALEQVEMLTGSKSTLQNFTDLLSEFVEKVRAVDNQLEQVKSKGTEARERINAFLSAQSEPEMRSLQNLPSLEDAHAKVKDMLLVMILQEQYTELSDKEIASRIGIYQEKLPSLAREREACRQRDEWMKSLEKLEEEVELLQKQASTLEEQQQKVVSEAQKVRIEYVETKTQKEKLFHAKDLDSYRELLSEGNPCPLCGATHHPFEDHAFQSEYGKLSLRHDQLEKLLSETEKSQQYLEKEIATRQAVLKTHLVRTSEIQSQIEAFSRDWPQIVGSEEADQKWTEANEELALLQSEVHQRTLNSLFSQFLELEKEVTKLREQYIEIGKARKDLCQTSDVVSFAGSIQKIIQTAKVEVHTAEIELEQKQLQRNNAKQLWLTSQKQLMTQLQALGYHTPEEAAAHMMESGEYLSYKENLETLLQKKTEALTRKSTHQKQLEEIQNMLLQNDTAPEEWQKLSDQLQQQLRELAQQLVAGKSKLEDNQKQQLIFQSKKAVLNERIKRANALIHLDRLLGDAEGNKFSKFAQNLSLQQLISLANKRLAKLTDRYTLVPTDIELDMRISDLYQGGIKRSVKTLSGGETFLVSLALALSLSDMASHNVRLDSLFIDEGFGTLDNETLDVAIASLEKLQSETNRTIGIISHVESLKERMSTQIKVQKNSHGYSHLVIE